MGWTTAALFAGIKCNQLIPNVCVNFQRILDIALMIFFSSFNFLSPHFFLLLVFVFSAFFQYFDSSEIHYAQFMRNSGVFPSWIQLPTNSENEFQAYSNIAQLRKRVNIGALVDETGVSYTYICERSNRWSGSHFECLYFDIAPCSASFDTKIAIHRHSKVISANHRKHLNHHLRL